MCQISVVQISFQSSERLELDSRVYVIKILFSSGWPLSCKSGKSQGIWTDYMNLAILPLLGFNLVISVSPECFIQKSWKILWCQGEVRENESWKKCPRCNLNSQGNKKFKLFSQGTYDFSKFWKWNFVYRRSRNVKKSAFDWLAAKLWLKESTILWNVCTFDSDIKLLIICV